MLVVAVDSTAAGIECYSIYFKSIAKCIDCYLNC